MQTYIAELIINRIPRSPGNFRGIFFCARILVLLVIIGTGSVRSNAQDSIPNKLTSSQKWVVYGSSGAAVGSLAALSAAWYNEPATRFHFFNDAGEWLQLDKAGHMTTSYQLMNINSSVFSWSGIDSVRALNIAAVQVLGYMAGIELLDGFSPGYGASLTDLAANTAGVVLYYVQAREKKTGLFSLKYSYHNSGLAGYRPGLLGNNTAERLIKDYNAQTYWLSVNLNEAVSPAIPRWLNLALGYGGTGMLGGKSNPLVSSGGTVFPVLDRRRQYSLSLDFNIAGFFPVKSKATRAIKFVSFVKIPLPGVQFSTNQNPQWKWFCY